MTDTILVSEEHSQVLATKWWPAEETMRNGKHLIPESSCMCPTHVPGIPCREGPFTEIEKKQAESAITRYKVVSELSMRCQVVLTI